MLVIGSKELSKEVVKAAHEIPDMVAAVLNNEENATTIKLALEILETLFKMEGEMKESSTEMVSLKLRFFEKEGLKKLEELNNHRDELCLKSLNEFMESCFPGQADNFIN